ncbi:hypothetical protein ACFLRF_04775 [Candidatus Altiarchaeota archaeon]
MQYFQDIQNLTVYDGAGDVLGILEGLNIILPDARVYLRIRGEQCKKFRGRITEFIPLAEVDLISDSVNLFKDVDSLRHVIEDIHMEYQDSHMVADVIGMTVRTNDRQALGIVETIFLSRKGKEAFILVKGGKVSDLNGKESEKIPLIDVQDITDEVFLNLDYDSLKERIEEGYNI